MAFDWISFLVSPQGRIPRSWFWLRFWLPLYLVMGALFSWIFVLLVANRYDADAMPAVPVILLWLLDLIVFWPSLAISIKRWHDRDKSGWYVLVVLIPIVGPIWSFVETGFLPGTPGPNRYGPDPLARRPRSMPDRDVTVRVEPPSTRPGGQQWVLSGLDGAGYPVRFPFSTADLGPEGLSIGRHSTSRLVLSDELVSRHHARIVLGDEGLAIEDLDSANGTSVGGQKLTSHIPRPLSAGSEISFGPRMTLTLSPVRPDEH